MEIITHNPDDLKIAEIVTDEVLINTIDDGLDLLGNLYYQGYESIILFTKNISTVFFDLKTGVAGEILQKFSNYKVRLAIVGDYTPYASKSFDDFVRESNKHKHINFVATKEEALLILSA
jgi:hypothetical protein